MRDANAHFYKLTTDYIINYYTHHPSRATASGIHDYDAELDNYDRFALRDNFERIRLYRHSIDHLLVSEMSAQNQLDCRVARGVLQREILYWEQHCWMDRNPSAYLDPLFTGLYLLMFRDFAPIEQRGRNLWKRLRQLPAALMTARLNLTTPPLLFTLNALDKAEAGIAFLQEAVPTFAVATGDRALQMDLEEVLGGVLQGLQEFTRFLRAELVPRSNGEFVLGREQYNYLLRVEHFVEENTEALLAIGWATLREANHALTQLTEQIAPGSCPDSTLHTLQQAHPTADMLLDAYTQAFAQARDLVRAHDLLTFPMLPASEAVRVVPMPLFACPEAGSAAYLSPAPYETHQQSEFWVATPLFSANPEQQAEALREHSRHAILLWALQAGYPGVHLQQSLANQTSSPFRRHFARSRLLAEGWALYSVEMLHDDSLYTNPRELWMRHHTLRLAACRLLADVQLHSRTMTPEQAIAFLQTEARLSIRQARAEVMRILLHPTQGMAGVMGRRALLALRAEAECHWGNRFSLKRFHDELLSHGGLPPALLREALFPAE